MRNAVIGALVLLIGLPVVGCAAEKVVTTESLLNELTDMRGIAEFPEMAFTCRQFSSYDRRSTSADQPEPAKEGWFANSDFAKFLRVEQREGRSEYVLMDAEGPGAIVRIWSANPKGTLRFYLDGKNEPALTVPMTELLGGDLPGVPKPIAGVCSKGWNSYYPIPYSSHCKITCDENEFYYHVNYRTYEPGTKVVSFSQDQFTRLKANADRLAKDLANPRRLGVFSTDPSFSRKQWGPSCTVVLQPGQSFKPNRVSGSQTIRLAARVQADDLEQAMRDVVLKIRFDGEQTVACPIGDFFGAAPGLNKYESLPMGVTDTGIMWSHWLMPFEKKSEIELQNMGKQTVRVNLHTSRQPYKWTDRSMHFHAKWRSQLDVPSRPMIDWNYLTAEGKGVFVGASFSIANPVKSWWGEGDEKIFVDGESFPSHFGTGTEDYFGYAWCSNIPFTHAYHNQPRCDGPGNYGHTCNNRWHIIDRIPFSRSFKFNMELWHWHTDCKVDMAVVAYWYARPGCSDKFTPIEPENLLVRKIPKYVPPKVDGAIEGETMRIIGKPDHGQAGPQLVGACSSESHMWWHHSVQVGDRLELGFDVEQAGNYHILARFVKARDYGIVRLSINGVPVNDPIDLYNDGVVVSDEVDLGQFDLPAGENRITVFMAGANEKAAKLYLFGLDYVRLETR